MEPSLANMNRVASFDPVWISFQHDGDISISLRFQKMNLFRKFVFLTRAVQNHASSLRNFVKAFRKFGTRHRTCPRQAAHLKLLSRAKVNQRELYSVIQKIFQSIRRNDV